MKIKFYVFTFLMAGSFLLILSIQFMFMGYVISFIPSEPYSLFAWYCRISVFILPYVGFLLGWILYFNKKYIGSICITLIVGLGPVLFGLMFS